MSQRTSTNVRFAAQHEQCEREAEGRVEPQPGQQPEHARLLDELEGRPVRRGQELRVLAVAAPEAPAPSQSLSRALLASALSPPPPGVVVRSVDLSERAFRPCPEGAPPCSWPCAITRCDPTDELGPVYRELVTWADLLVIAAPVGAAGPGRLFREFLERLRCIPSEREATGRQLLRDKAACVILLGPAASAHRHGAAALYELARMGFSLPPQPLAGAHTNCAAGSLETSAGPCAGDPALAADATALVERAIDLAWRVSGPPRGDAEAA